MHFSDADSRFQAGDTPRASFMAHHIGDFQTSSTWAAICNELCFRVSELFPDHFIPAAMLPEVKDCAAEFGTTQKSLFGAEIPILGVAGDQQAATIGQACFQPGMMKSTYGTGCFALLNTGDKLVRSRMPKLQDKQSNTFFNWVWMVVPEEETILQYLFMFI